METLARSLIGTLITLVLLRLGSAMPVIGFYIRVFISFVCLILCAAYGVIASICLRLVGYGGLSQWTVARAFKWTMRLAVGVEFVVQNEQYLNTSPPLVIICNHQTELDVLMIGCVFPHYTSVTSKKSLKYWPFLGWFMALSKTVFIDRGNRQSARASFDSAARTMRSERQSVFIFPEGTRSYTSEPTMLPFKKGAFHLAVQAGVPIVPVVVANYSNVLSLQRKVFRSGRIPVKALRPIETKDLAAADVDNLVDRVRRDMQEELLMLTHRARREGTAVTDPDAKKEHDKKAS